MRISQDEPDYDESLCILDWCKYPLTSLASSHLSVPR